MKTLKKLDQYFDAVSAIKYDNEHGGAYAYIQLLAFNREILKLLSGVKNVERQIDAIEAVNWMFNEYLATKFTYRHRAIFENNIRDLKQVYSAVRTILNNTHLQRSELERVVHAQAA